MSEFFPDFGDITAEQFAAMVKASERSQSCRYNDGVLCSPEKPRICGTCGWNPVVAQKRSNAIIFRLKAEGVIPVGTD